ncbi:FadR/GntR family transcriptional regulator [soil metagenome]
MNSKLIPTFPGTGSDEPEGLETLSVFGPIARLNVVDAVAERIRGESLAGRLTAGSKLPSERELALALGINRLTLRAALARLEALGLIITRHGAGTVVASWRERAGLDALASLAAALDPAEPAWHDMLASILEVRRVLAAEAVALAVERHTEEDVQAMEAAAADQQKNLGDPLALARGDVMFQRAVIRAAKNVGLELILNSFARLPEDHPQLVAALYDDPDRTISAYPIIIELVRSGRPEEARTLVRQALAAADATLLERQLRNLNPASTKKQAPLVPPAVAVTETTATKKKRGKKS